MQRISEDASKKLDFIPGVTVERHIRGKWVCRHCETLIQAPVPAQVIDKGLATSGLLAQVLCPSTPTTFPYTSATLADKTEAACSLVPM